MPAITVDQFLQRAHSALAMPTLYVLGQGAWTGNGPVPAQPGTPFDSAAVLQALAQRPETVDPKVRHYFDEARSAGVDLARLPARACDCSAYVAWCLGVPRSPSPLAGNSFWTNGIWADVDRPGGQGQMFRLLDRPMPGALIVYPGRPDKDEVGHVAIVSEVVGGQVSRILHCAPENYLSPSQPGAERNAIASTDASHFEGRARVRHVMALALQT